MDLVADLIPDAITKFSDSNKPSIQLTKADQYKTEQSSREGTPREGSSKDAPPQLSQPPMEGSELAADSAIQNPDLLWRSCLDLIRAQLDAQIFAAWIRPLRLIEASQEGKKFSLLIAATNKFSLDHVQRHYSELIADAAASVLMADSLGLSFRVESKRAIAAEGIPSAESEQILRESTRSIPGAARALARDAANPPRTSSTRRSAAMFAESDDSCLNPKYNFSNFVVGSCNQFAQAACLRVAETPGCNYNPLFLYGGVGLGKTHLANAIGNSTRRQNKKVLLVSSEAFVSELIVSLRSNRMQQFKEKFRTLDLLIIDDIQFIIGKERTQEEFFHTFNDLYNRRKQIVITSDTVPQELSGIEERLRTRFACGLAVDLQTPDLETRVAILTKKAETAGVHLSIDVARYVADAINTNVRELEGAFHRLQAMSSLKGSNPSEISLELAQEVVRDLKPRRQVEITTELIQRTVAERYNVSLGDLLGKRRTHNVALARQVAMFLCRKLTPYSYPEIGAYFGGRDHSTVIHSYRSVEEKSARDNELSAILDQLTRSICG